MAKITQKSEFTANFSHQLESEIYDIGNFPVQAFPKTLQKCINELHDCYNFPPEFQAAGILSAAAVVIGNKMQVLDSTIWNEPIKTNLYFVNIAGSGVGKSPSRKFYYQYLIENSRQDAEKVSEAKALLKQYILIPKGKASEDKTANETKRQELEAQFNSLAMGGDIKTAVLPTLYPHILEIGQTSYESIIHIFAKRNLELKKANFRRYQHGLLLASDELHSLIKSVDRYESNMLTGLNQAYDNEDITASTIQHGVMYGANPHIVMAGDLQWNKPLQDMYRAENTNSGFAQRIFAAIPEAAVKMKKTSPNETHYKNVWKAMLQVLNSVDMYGTRLNQQHPERGQFIPLTKAARTVYLQFLEDLHKKEVQIMALYPNSWQLAAMKKGRSSVVRLALILEMLDFAEKAHQGGVQLGDMLNTIFPKGISHEAMERALQLFDYYMNVNAYLGNLEQDDSQILPKKEHRDFYKNLPDKFRLPVDDILTNLTHRTQQRVIHQLIAAGRIKKQGQTYTKL
jgi:hypothetical protein